MKEEQLFHKALQQPAAERAEFLAAACGRDVGLRQRVEAILKAHECPGSFLQSPAGAEYVATVVDRPMSERPGTIIGPYKLLEQIGEGGFGVVFMAEQIAPVKRRVALKVIKPGMDTRQVIARFEAERQALALMDHTHIARVLDAGATETGRPYFVMELVRGIPITDYCDQCQLTPRQRLELFMTVCQAVQHAHHKGIIHRDIKPSNVLVTLHDDKPVVKVIDFGIAKATTGQLTDKTLFTGFAQMIGTPLYMSPEQAAMSGMDVDTRSDIYSLGVLLYELLTGTTPFDKTRLHQAAFDEIRRIIREEEPQKPSTRLSSLGATLPSVSALRRTEPRKLSQIIRGDLDWIVMKALEKDRSRRYESANGFASDVLSYLNHEAVTACPPSALYRFRKFARRNSAALATAATISVALILTTIGLAVSNIRVRAERNQKIQALHERERALREKGTALDEREAALQQARDNLVEARRQERLANENAQLANENLAKAEAGFADARRAVDEFLTKVTDSQLLEAPGLQTLRRDLLRSALAFYEEFLEQRGDDPQLQASLAGVQIRVSQIYSELGDRRWRIAMLAAKALYEQILERVPKDADARAGLAYCCRRLGDHTTAVTILKELLRSDPANRGYRSELADAYNSLALAAGDDELDSRLAYHQKALEIRQKLVEDFPDDAYARRDLGGTLNNIGAALKRQGHERDALAMYLSAVEQQQAAFDRNRQGVNVALFLLTGCQNVAITQWTLGEFEAAERSYHRWLELAEQLVADNPAVPVFQARLWFAHWSYSGMLTALERLDEANASRQQGIAVLERLPRKTADDYWSLASMRSRVVASFDESQTTLNFEHSAERDATAAAAVADLQRAVELGADDANRFLTDPDLEAIRDRDDFQALVARVRSSTETAAQLARIDQVSPAALVQTGQSLLTQQEALVDQDPGSRRFRSELAAARHAIGLALLRTDRHAQGETLLQEAISLRETLLSEVPTYARYALDVGQSRLVLGRLYWSAQRYAEAEAQWQQALGTMESALASEPSDSVLWQEVDRARFDVAEFYVYGGLWEEAAELASRIGQPSNVFGTNTHLWHLHALLRRFAGDDEGFRNVCTQLHATVASPDFDFYRTVLAGPAALPKETMRDLMSAAERDQAGNPENGWYRVFLAQFHDRLGEHDAALEQLNAVSGNVEIKTEPIRALILHHLGRTDEARELLQESDRIQDDWFRSGLTAGRLNSSGPINYPIVRLLHLVLWREAHSEIEGRHFVDTPYRQLVRAGRLACLGRSDASESAITAVLNLCPGDAEVEAAAAALLEQLGRRDDAETHWSRAEEILKQALILNPDEAPLLNRAGRIRAERGDWEGAATVYVRLIDLLQTPNPPDAGIELWQLVREILLHRELFDRVYGQRKDDAKFFQMSLERCVLNQQWELALELGQDWMRQHPDDHWRWFLLASVQVYCGDLRGYRQACQDGIERFAATDDHMTAQTVSRTCLLIADALPDPQPAITLAEWANREGDPGNQKSWCELAYGMALYRMGRFDEAANAMDRVLEYKREHVWEVWRESSALAILAMCRQRLGAVEQARDALQQARQRPTTEFPYWPNPRIVWGGTYSDCLRFLVLLREAEALIEDKHEPLPLQANSSGN